MTPMLYRDGAGPSRVKWAQDPGWRGLIGFISPPNLSIDPTEFLRVAPDGFQTVQTVIQVPGFKLTAEKLGEGVKQLEGCCLALKQCGVDVIAQSGTPFAFLNGSFHSTKNACDQLEKACGVPVVMMGVSVANALRRRNYGSTAVACTYYSDDLAARYSKFLEDAGIKVCGMENWVCQKIFPNQEEIDRLLTPRLGHRAAMLGRVYRAASMAARNHPEAECIVVSGGGVCTIDILEALEEDIGKPVICSLAAQFWDIFVSLDTHPRLTGWGSLLGSLARG